MRRFTRERTPQQKPQSFVGDNPQSRFLWLSDAAYPRLRVTFGGADDFRDPLEVEVADFIGCKSFKAKGKRLTTLEVAAIEELEPLRQPEPEEAPQPALPAGDAPDGEADEAVLPGLFDEADDAQPGE